MKERTSKVIKGSMLCILLCASSGCVDCSFSYHVNGVLVSAPSREPIADANVIVSVWRCPDTNEITSYNFRFFRTESNGAFSDTYITGLTWGYCLLNPFPWVPVPPELTNIFVGVQLPDGQWYIQDVNLTADMQKKKAPAERWINLGTVEVPAAKLEDD